MQARGRLGNALPIVIEGGEEWEEAAEELDSMFLGDAEVWYAPGQFHICTAILRPLLSFIRLAQPCSNKLRSHDSENMDGE